MTRAVEQLAERDQPLWLVGAPPAWLDEALVGQRQCARYPRIGDAADDLSWRRPLLIILSGPRAQQRELLAAVEAMADPKPKLIACGTGLRAADESERAQVYYELDAPVTQEELTRLLDSLRRRSNLRELLPSGEGIGIAEQSFAAARNVAAEQTPAGIARAMEQETARLAGAARVRCLLFDEHEGVLWREEPTEALELRPPQGLSGWCALTQETRLVTRAREDGRYRRQVDDPLGAGEERLLVVPVSDHRGECHAVLVAVRCPEQPPFEDRTRRLVQSLAKAFAPHLAQLSFEAAVARRRLGELADRLGSDDMFREEALEAYAAPRTTGQVLRISRRMDMIFWVILCASLWGVAFVASVRVPTYSEGSALIRLGKDVEITAPAAGRVDRLLAAPGAFVRRGEPLVYLFGDGERADLERAELEWAAAQRTYLADPQASGASLLLTAQAQRDAQRAAIERKRVLAPYDGLVSEHRVRVGQAVQAGQVLTAVVPPDSRAYVVAALPGSDRARIAQGQVLHLELDGHRRVSIDVTIDSLSGGVLGAAEVREWLGAASESMQVPSSVTLVTAPLPSTTFQDHAETYALSHGMVARAAVEVSSDTLLGLLLPDLGRNQ